MAETPVTSPPEFVERLADALGRELRGARVDVEHVRGNRYRFVVLWDGFDETEHPERQNLVWQIAERVVPRPDLLDVGMILTVAPSDYPETNVL
jgi:hypothetical protein